MKINTILILIVSITISCQNNLGKQIDMEKTIFFMPVKVTDTSLPMRLDRVNFEDKTISLSEVKRSRIQEEVQDYFFDEYGGTEALSFYSVKGCYIHTIQVQSKSNLTLYWILFRHMSGKINSKILFFDKTKKMFYDYVYNHNIHALYNEIDGQLIPTNLKELFEIEFPEIERVNFDGDDFPDFKFTRLYHNGTSNAIEETIIEFQDAAVDTLKFERNWIS